MYMYQTIEKASEFSIAAKNSVFCVKSKLQLFSILCVDLEAKD